MKKNLTNFAKLLEIMDNLRQNCPWDKKQTMLTLRNNTIEECFELTDAILDQDMTHIKEELGDMLLHIVFYSKIASETGEFDIEDVAAALNEKLIYRHPHIFADATANTPQEVSANWEALKIKKRADGVLSGVPRGMPALPKALRIGQKAASVGFDWPNRADVWGKVKEEIGEFQAEIEGGEQQAIEDEFGDILFSLVNVARKYNIDPEAALERTNKKFIARFAHIEKGAQQLGKPINELSLDEMEALWCDAKING